MLGRCRPRLDVKIPPPLFFVAAIVLAASFNAFAPLPIALLPEGTASLIGDAFIVLGIFLAMLSQRELRRAKTPQLPGTQATSLVTTGPYAISRNPIYLAWAILQLGLGIWLRNAWIVVLLVPAIAIVNAVGVIPEERYLQAEFGPDYQEYRRRVRRWL
jgi:protein-S-isoprenylcysteine O-methyltransferase Ste14